MQVVTRAFLALAVFFLLILEPLFGRIAGAGGAPPGHSGPPGHGGNRLMNGNRGNSDNQGDDEGRGGVTSTGLCGSEPGDTDELASVRATAADQCDCAGARDHGRYVSCVAQVADAAVQSGSLRQACRDSVMRCAAKSVCGKKDSVTCCRTDARGNAKCSIKHSATECKAPRGGTAALDLGAPAPVLGRIAVATGLAGVVLLGLAEARWAHAVGVAALLSCAATAFLALTPALLPE